MMQDKDNVGVWDTAIRSVLSCILLAVAVEGIFPAMVSVMLVVIGLVLWTTASTGICWLYKLFGIDTYHHAR
jgi:hypothetical protein